MATGNVFCRRHKVLKSGTDHSNPVKANRLSTKPVVCRKGKPNSTLIPSRDIAVQCPAGQWSGMPESPRRCRLAGGRAFQMASLPKPSQHQTRLTANHAVSGPCCNLTSSWSYMSSVSNCSFTPAITLDSHSEPQMPIYATKPEGSLNTEYCALAFSVRGIKLNCLSATVCLLLPSRSLAQTKMCSCTIPIFDHLAAHHVSAKRRSG